MRSSVPANWNCCCSSRADTSAVQVGIRNADAFRVDWARASDCVNRNQVKGRSFCGPVRLRSSPRGGVDMVRLLALIAFPVMALAQPPLVPLLWTQGQSPETIRQVVREVADGGNTGFVWESRPHPDYLGPRWWADLRVAVDEAKRLKLEVWIFDEWMYPSGVAGGKVAAQHPESPLHTVEERTLVVQGPAAERDWEIPTPVAVSEQVVSVVAFAEPTRPGQDTVILPGGTRVRWAAPDGRWRICWSLARSHAPRPGWRMTNMIDVMNPSGRSRARTRRDPDGA